MAHAYCQNTCVSSVRHGVPAVRRSVGDSEDNPCHAETPTALSRSGLSETRLLTVRWSGWRFLFQHEAGTRRENREPARRPPHQIHRQRKAPRHPFPTPPPSPSSPPPSSPPSLLPTHSFIPENRRRFIRITTNARLHNDDSSSTMRIMSECHCSHRARETMSDKFDSCRSFVVAGAPRLGSSSVERLLN